MKGYSIKTPQQLGAILRGYRNEHGLTQAAVGEKVGVAQKVISQIETNSGSTSLARVLKVLAALDLELTVGARKTDDRQREW